MVYYTDLFSPETYEAFSRSPRDVTGFRLRQRGMAERVRSGDRFICYITKLSRWAGVLEVVSELFVDDAPRFYATDDPFVVRFKVKPVAWLAKDKSIPIHEPVLWDHLTFTKNSDGSGGWTGMVRRSLNQLKDDDGVLLERLICAQVESGQTYEIDEDKYARLVTQRIRREDKSVAVTVPTADDEQVGDEEPEITRESAHMQGLLAMIGEKMGFKIWVPRHDRGSVLREWTPEAGALVDHLPLNYDDTTLKTIEQIDVLWLKGRSIVRAFEVEHTTAIYSGILRMADLLALQPNMDIKLHIVAPEMRKLRVFNEIQRPVFSLLDRAPLSECCTFISYDSLRELAEVPHLSHLSDSVLEEYAEEAE